MSGHHFADLRRGRIEPEGYDSNCNVAIREDANRPLVIADSEKADASFCHLRRRASNGSGGIDHLDRLAHQIGDAQVGTPR